MTDTRQAFEAWAKSASLDVDSKVKDGWGQDKYLPHIESMWVGWQAALAAPQPEPQPFKQESWITAARLVVEATPEQLPMAIDALRDVIEGAKP